MRSRTIPGVPVAMQQDGWWLDASMDRVARGKVARRRDGCKMLMLLALIALGDALVWHTAPGLNLVVFAVSIFLAALSVSWSRLTRRRRYGVAGGVAFSVLPLIELVQPLSFLIAVVGLSVCMAALAGLSRADLLRGGVRLWWVAPIQCLSDGARGVRRVSEIPFIHSDLRGIAMTWALPVAATFLFALLLLAANPVLDRWLVDLTSFTLSGPGWVRASFWGFLAVLIWPALVTYRMSERLRARRLVKVTVTRPGLINPRSVARSLVAFNLLFAVQTGMDFLFLYGDATLPDGMSPATYAHRGAYPLLATALLAGVFAVAATPFLSGRPTLRAMMLFWLLQTLALVGASLWRLEVYVDAFGLTRLRLAAYIWMWLVAVGLGLVAWQIWRDKPATWMMLRSGVVGAVVLYACAFHSFDGHVARYNLNMQREPDLTLLCASSEDVIPAMAARFGLDWRAACAHTYQTPELFQPLSWREWGFRNWRTRNSLQAMTEDLAAP